MLVLSRTLTESLLDLDELRRAVAAAMTELSAGRVSMPQRIAARVDSREAMVAAMPAYIPSSHGLAVKLVSLFPTNAGTGIPTHQAVVIVFDESTGTPVAMLDGASITAARTAAGSALSVELVARQDSRVLAILGNGVQARSHLLAVTRVRRFAEIKVAGRDASRMRVFARKMSEELGLPIRVSANFAEACEGADVICAATHSPDPVVQRGSISPGAHVTSVGYNTAGREVDSSTIAEALVIVESRDAVLAAPPSGSPDIRIPIEEGRIGPEHIHTEIGELVAGTRPGRTTPEQITLYKSVGVAVQDVAAASLVLQRAHEKDVGVEVEL